MNFQLHPPFRAPSDVRRVYVVVRYLDLGSPRLDSCLCFERRWRSRCPFPFKFMLPDELRFGYIATTRPSAPQFPNAAFILVIPPADISYPCLDSLQDPSSSDFYGLER